jgi:glucosamine--fructose-6-phosphate aminotransferase (isomerizing)
MCGIVGYVGEKEALPILIEGLKRLEYRGYDSAGVAVLNGANIASTKCAGKISALESALASNPLHGTIGIGHTRWATHGRPNDENAHPHTDCKQRFAVVHNGIIENYLEIKEKLLKAGHVFRTETDTEVIPHLIETHYHGNLEHAVMKALEEIRGSYALGVTAVDEPNKIVAARMGSPLVIGIGKKENYLASDIPALLPFTREALVVEDGEVAVLSPSQVFLFTRDGKKVERNSFHVLWDSAMAEKGGYKHFMLKEIFEQPKVISETLAGRLLDNTIQLEIELPKKISGVFFTAAGTAYHAGMVGKYLFETLAGIPAETDLSSEFRYRSLALPKDVLVIAISQSGETADTLAALREAKRRGNPVLAITNVVGSSIAREAPSLFTRAGIEIGVAATKTFVSQLTALVLLALKLAQEKKRISKEEEEKIFSDLYHLPKLADLTLQIEEEVKHVAKLFGQRKDFLYLGRHIHYPIALEGALKLKEISYIHAEGYAAGEMKHGPIALIDENVPVVAVAQESPVLEKLLSNLEEVKAREATVIAVTEESGKAVRKCADYLFSVPKIHWLLSPILGVIPLQMLAYFIADRKGCDVDQPRNLAKSVTVE